MRKVFPVIFFTLFYSNSIFSQSILAVTEKQAETFYEEIKTALESFSGSKDPQVFYKYFDDSFKGTTTTLRPKRTPVIKNTTYATLFSDFRRNLSDGSVYNYKNFNLEHVIINDPYAVLSIKHDYYISRGDDIRLEGSTIVSYVLKNINNELKIVSSSSIINIPAEYVGDCFCRFYSENNDYSITIEYPYGGDFGRVVESVYKIPGDRGLFNYDGKTYRWDGTLKVFKYNPTTDSDVKVIGDANSMQMAMVKAIQNEAYQDICLNMRIYNK